MAPLPAEASPTLSLKGKIMPNSTVLGTNQRSNVNTRPTISYPLESGRDASVTESSSATDSADSASEGSNGTSLVGAKNGIARTDAFRRPDSANRSRRLKGMDERTSARASRGNAEPAPSASGTASGSSKARSFPEGVVKGSVAPRPPETSGKGTPVGEVSEVKKPNFFQSLRSSFKALAGTPRAKASVAVAGVAAPPPRARGCLDLLEPGEPSPKFKNDLQTEQRFNAEAKAILLRKAERMSAVLEDFANKTYDFADIGGDRPKDFRDMSLMVQHVVSAWKASHNPFGLSSSLAAKLELYLKKGGFLELHKASQKWSSVNIVPLVQQSWSEAASRPDAPGFEAWFKQEFSRDLNRVAAGIIEMNKFIAEVLDKGEEAFLAPIPRLWQPATGAAEPAASDPAVAEPHASSVEPGSHTPPEAVLSRSAGGRTPVRAARRTRRRTGPVQKSWQAKVIAPVSVPAPNAASISATAPAVSGTEPSAVLPAMSIAAPPKPPRGIIVGRSLEALAGTRRQSF